MKKRFFIFFVCMLAILLVGCADSHTHEYGEWSVVSNPTKTNNGLIQRVCSLDSLHIDKRELPALGKDKYEYVVIKESSCTEVGEAKYIYTIDSQKFEFSAYIDLKEHQKIDVEQYNDTYHKCQCHCGEVSYEEHNFLVSNKVDGATCTSSGKTIEKCKVCGIEKQITVAKKEHVKGELVTIKDATCKETGLKERRCTVCSEVIETVIIEKEKHNLTDWQIVSVASCTQEGKKVKVCTKCLEEVEVEYSKKLGHTAKEIEKVEPTCMSEGTTAGMYCDKCDKVIHGIEPINKVDHIYVDGVCKWCNLEQKIVVNYFDGEKLIDTKEFKYNESITFPSIADENEGKYIEGWYSLDGSIKYDESFKLIDNINVYVKWREEIGIGTKEGLVKILDNPNGYYYLKNSIDLKGMTWNPITEFNGVLDGKGYEIKNFTITSNKDSKVAFILKNNGTVKNLTINDVLYTVSNSINNNDTYYAIFIGENYGVVDNVTLKDSAFSFTKSVEAFAYDISTCLSPFVAYNAGSISNSKNNVNMTITIGGVNRIWFRNYVGGICGKNESKINDCYSNVEIKINYIGHSQAYADENVRFHTYTGGIVGYNSKTGEVERSNSYLKFSNTRKDTWYQGQTLYLEISTGAFVGLNDGYINESISNSNITTDIAESIDYVGGFVGRNGGSGKIENCYSIGNVNSLYQAYIGGFVGKNDSVVLTSYSDCDVTSSGNSSSAGFVGYNGSSGSVSKCFSIGDVTIKEGKKGYFIGTNVGTIHKNYYYTGSSIYIDSEKLETESDDYSLVVGKSYNDITSKGFLSDEIYWDTDVWYIDNSDSSTTNILPELIWYYKLGHYIAPNITITKIEATCTEYGFTVYQCNCCDLFYISDYVSPHGHEYVSKEIDVTCTTDGQKFNECNICHNIEVYEITKALGHDIDTSVLEKPECNDNDVIESIEHAVCCSRCETNEIVTVYEHNFILEEYIDKPTCTEKGQGKYICSLCEKDEIMEVDNLGHQDINYDNICDECEITLTEGLIEINTIEELENIKMDGKYILASNLDFKDVSWIPLGTKDSPFTGFFYGNDKVISNIILEGKNGIAGLFGYNNGTICGLVIEDYSIIKENLSVMASPIAVYNNGKIFDCNIRGNNTVRVVSKSFVSEYEITENIAVDFQFGNFSCVNNGEIAKCNIDANTKITMLNNAEVDVKWGLDNITCYYYKTTKAITKLNVIFGYLAGTNTGIIKECSINETGNVIDATYVLSTNHVGHASTTTNIYFGYVCGINNNGETENITAEFEYSPYLGNITHSFEDGALVGSFWSEILEIRIYNDSNSNGYFGISK